MTNSTRLIGLIMTAVLWVSQAAAQGPPTSRYNEDVPPDLALPLPDSVGPPPTATTQPSMGVESLPSPATAGSAAAPVTDGYDLTGECAYPDLGGMWNAYAPIESTSTWLQRGFWYAETDAVILNKVWDRDSLRLAAQDQNVNLPPINPNPPIVNGSLGFNPLFLNTNRILILNGALPGEDAAVRATLGNFLFRDSRNRDHTVEFTVFGGANWEQDRELASAAPNGLFVPWFIDGGNRSFDRSTRQTVEYESNLDSFELNYRVRGRLGHDQLVMDANGNWHRAANHGWERDYLAGLRFLELSEKLDWRAEDIINAGDDGRYLIHADNDLFGFQMGTNLTYQTARWSFGTRVKGGVFLNDALGRSQLNFTADDTGDADLRLRENQLSFVGEFGLQGKFHVLPNVSVRAGYDLMFISSVAQAPNQATFITDFSFLNTSGGSFYHGASFGAEWYW